MRRPVQRRARVAALAALHPVLARVYAGRGVQEVRDLELGLDHLLPVGTLDGIEAAVDVLLSHRTRGTRLLVIGDYDADGATASALMVRTLRGLGFEWVDYLVPNRFKFGYGLTPEIVAAAQPRKPDCLITVDNGIASLEGVAAARGQGMDVLITDHHLPGAQLPDATAIVNPNLPGARFASRALSGVGVAFYLMAAVARRLAAASGIVAARLDLVALGTVADVVPLDRNNRILVHQGLKRIRAGRGVAGVAALAATGNRTVDGLTAGDLGFVVAPRLNAAGRLDDMSLGIECLLSDDPARALELARELDRLNSERRTIEARMQEEAQAIVARLGYSTIGASLPAGLCLYDEAWHPGVVGLVASRVKDQVHRPVIAFAPAEAGLARGSARSISGIHVRDVLEAVATANPGLIRTFGGHAMAAGVTLEANSLRQFANLFAAEAARRADPNTIAGLLLTDGELAPAELGLETAHALRDGGPWGAAFPEPSFDGEFAVVESRLVGAKHLKLWLRATRDSPPVEAMVFDWRARAAEQPVAGAQVVIVYRLVDNAYQGRSRAELVVEYLEVKA
jgi:single-stranded-DNA-specific exonuclease